MEFTSRLSTATDTQGILSELSKGGNAPFDLGILFTSYETSIVPELIELLPKHLPIRNLIGCTCAGIVGSNTEIERQSACSLILGRLPGVKIIPYVINQIQLEGLKTPADWYSFFEIYPNEHPIFLALPDPFTFDANLFLNKINEAYPGAAIMGGLASGINSLGENLLIQNSDIHQGGAVGIVLTGDVRIAAVVSQGCRPIGQTYIITKAEENIIHTLAGKPFINILREVLAKLSSRDQLLAQEALFVGIAMDEYKHAYKRGDFLIRGLMGIDEKTGAGVVADYVKTGQTIQFHLRDAQAAVEDLNELLAYQKKSESEAQPKGALVFCCNGRGEYLFRQKNHDIQIIQKHIGPIPAAGFFCAGEIGPVGGSNFLHGFTNSIALFYPAAKVHSPA